MFTGIITDIGTIKKIEKKSHIHTFEIECNYNADEIALGASISCNGACLTVTKKEKNISIAQLWFDLSPETLEKTVFKYAAENDRINLERSLKLGDELGGHLVSGHVDTVANVKHIQKSEDNWIVKFDIDKEFIRFISEKGSVTISGVSLTVNKTNDCEFEVNIIPHTLKNTNFYLLKIGDKVNIEIDMISRYLSKLINPKFL